MEDLPISERRMGQGWLAMHLCFSGGLGLWEVFPRGDSGSSCSRGIESCAVSRAVVVLLQGMNSTSFENRSTTTRIESKSFDNGRSVVKSAVTSVQGMSGSSSGRSFPGEARLDGLIWTHLSHLFVYSLMNSTHSGPSVTSWY
jgi:hypothetical protein